jgi:hypothetical protein
MRAGGIIVELGERQTVSHGGIASGLIDETQTCDPYGSRSMIEREGTFSKLSVSRRRANAPGALLRIDDDELVFET